MSSQPAVHVGRHLTALKHRRDGLRDGGLSVTGCHPAALPEQTATQLVTGLCPRIYLFMNTPISIIDQEV